jgi:hypothetical protein
MLLFLAELKFAKPVSCAEGKNTCSKVVNNESDVESADAHTHYKM